MYEAIQTIATVQRLVTKEINENSDDEFDVNKRYNNKEAQMFSDESSVSDSGSMFSSEKSEQKGGKHGHIKKGKRSKSPASSASSLSIFHDTEKSEQSEPLKKVREPIKLENKEHSGLVNNIDGPNDNKLKRVVPEVRVLPSSDVNSHSESKSEQSSSIFDSSNSKQDKHHKKETVLIREQKKVEAHMKYVSENESTVESDDDDTQREAIKDLNKIND